MQPEQDAFILTVIDVTGIQPYIFGSNNLQHIVGASGRVHWATSDAVYASLLAVCEPERTNVDGSGRLDADLRIEEGAVDAELIYAGGGNTFILFRNKPLAVAFTQKLTHTVLQEARGLQLVVAHVPFTWIPGAPAKSQALVEIVGRGIQALGEKKRAGRLSGSGLLGLSVTADCQYTGLPAVAEAPKARSGSNLPLQRISAETKAKRNGFGAADNRLRDVVRKELGDYDFIYDFDEIGTKHESSFIAVVHMDGNGMGRRVQAIAGRYNRPEDNRDYIKAMRGFSKRLDDAGCFALKETVSYLAGSVKDGKLGDAIAVTDRRLPFRPIVFGGDDVTFVCDGRLALTLAHYYMTRLEEQQLYDGERLYVRAGIAVVNNHYPFAAAYALAEELAGSAKAIVKEHTPAGANTRLSALDWHFAVSGLARDLDTLRAQDYQESKLTLRPLLLKGSAELGEWRTWPNFMVLLDRFSDPQGPWVEKRNKVKALRDALRAGPEATRQFMAPLDRNHELPSLGQDKNSSRNGWVQQFDAGGKVTAARCAWYDAVEAVDFYLPLGEAADKEEADA